MTKDSHWSAAGQVAGAEVAMPKLVRYCDVVSDSARWTGFPFRPDDIVISTAPKSGTTWIQMLCAMLIFDAVTFDRPLAEISPWLDMQTNDLRDVNAALQAQRHRRFIKTHTPLDGVPLARGVTYICVGRDPRDVALSFQHHWRNLDLDAFMKARARAVGLDDLDDDAPLPELPEDASEWFRLWMDADPGSLIGPALVDVLHHISTFWDRRHDPRVALFHYSDLLADMPTQLRRLADVLAIRVTDERIQEFAAAATFDSMKGRADELVPDVRNHIWRSNQDFFHSGSTGHWRDLLADADLRHYERRVADLVRPEIAVWAHLGWSGLDDAARPRTGR
jgi:aryl sulfotransferase